MCGARSLRLKLFESYGHSIFSVCLASGNDSHYDAIDDYEKLVIIINVYYDDDGDNDDGEDGKVRAG